MSVELICLLLSTLLGFVYLNAHAITLQRPADGSKVDPNRDREAVLTVHGARAVRALKNFLETYPFFIALVVVIELSAHHGVLTLSGSILYLVARAAYLPLYIAGLAPMRSLSWVLALIGLIMMFIGVLI